MALAVLRFEEASDGVARFHVDIGHNLFYRYRIGNEEVRNDGGFTLLAHPHHESEIIGPLSSATLGRTQIEIPLSLFGRNTRFVQLTSFRRPPDAGATISEITEVPFGVLGYGLPSESKAPYEADTVAPRNSHRAVGQKLEAPGMPQQREMSFRTPIVVQHKNTNGGGSNEYDARINRRSKSFGNGIPHAASFTFREAQYSNAMFLEAIGSLLSSALPVINQVIGGLGGANGIGNILGGLFGGVRPPAPVANPSGANPQSVTPDLARQIAELIRLLSSPQPTPPTPSNAGVTRTQSLSGYSQGMIAPALLAAIPMLAPLLEKVLNPQTINAITSNIGPKATIGAVTDAIKDIGGMNIQAYQNILDHIQQNMPSSDTTPLLNHLLAVTQSLAEPSILPSYRRVDSVKVHYAAQASLLLRGREQTVYRADAAQGITFPVTVETPRPIAIASIYLLVKEVETLRVVAQKNWDVEHVVSGTLVETPHLSLAEMGALLPGNEYLVCTYLVWKTKRGELIGASRTQTIYIMGEYAYQGVEAGGEIVPLNDVEKFRPYWHKIWQESFTREKRRWLWDCKYYYSLHNTGGPIEYVETVTEENEAGGRRIEGRMKSGLRLSLPELNALLPQISPHQPLNMMQLEALSAPAAIAAFSRAARSKAEFRGSDGDSVALWIYPEMRIQPIVLLRTGEPNKEGLVGEIIEETVHFPVPALAHFVGVSTEKDPYPALNETEEM